jgi:hypothetical protein
MRLNITLYVQCLSILKINCSARYSEFGMMKEDSNLGHLHNEKFSEYYDLS